VAPFKHILVPTDFGAASDAAVALALDVASRFGSQVTLLHATWLPSYYALTYAEGLAWPVDELEGEARQALDAALANARKRYPNVEGSLVAGEPWERILEAAKQRNADLVIMGTHGRRGFSRVFLGSVAEKVVRLAPIPVMTVSAEAERRAKEKGLKVTAAR
jgi:nucleotide-binding universal stress UspA family protein